MYRVAPATRLVVYGLLGLLLIVCVAAVSSRFIASLYLWSTAGIWAVVLAVLVKRRSEARGSEHIKIDDAAINTVGRAGFRVLPWAGVAFLRVPRRGALELSDASRANTITLSRRYERFPELVADVLRHLNVSYEARTSGARRHSTGDLVRFASSVLPEVLQVLGSLAWTAASAWLNPLEALFDLARRPLTLSWLDPLAFVVGLVWIPVALWRLGRVPYAVTVGPAAVTLTTLIGTREIPTEYIAAVGLVSDRRGRPKIVIAETNGEHTAFRVSRLTERPLELYDLLRELPERPASTAPAPTTIASMRLAPARAAAYIASCAVVGLAVASIPIFNGGVLRFASAHGYPRVAKTALQLGSPVDFRGTTGMTPLCLASRDGHLPIVRLLLARGANPAGPCRDNEFTPLHVASQNGHAGIVRALLDAGVSPDIRNSDGRTPLSHLSFMNGSTDVPVATMLLDRGASIDLADNQGFTPIYWAVMGENLPMIRYLAAQGARLDARTNEGFTASMEAVSRGCVECLRMLAQGGADMNARSPKRKTLLMRAAEHGDPRIILVLMDAGAQPDLVDQEGYTALQIAVWQGRKDAASILLARGVDPNAASADTGTPLYLAVQRHQPELVRLLLERGARWDLGYGDLTSLQRAARGGEADMVRAMLDRGADPNASTATQPPPLVLASDQGHLEVVSLLIARGADVRNRWKDWTPLRAAQVHGRDAVVGYLRAHGAQ